MKNLELLWVDHNLLPFSYQNIFCYLVWPSVSRVKSKGRIEGQALLDDICDDVAAVFADVGREGEVYDEEVITDFLTPEE